MPTAGENLEVVFKALVGATSQRLWDSGLPESQTLRVIILDEKRRLEVYRVAAGVHRIGELIAGRRVRQILMVSGGLLLWKLFDSAAWSCVEQSVEVLCPEGCDAAQVIARALM